jgi:hypothetical protein
MRWTWVIGMRRRQFRQTHLAGLGIEPPNVVGFFVGEPQNAIVIEYGCVRIDLAAAGWDHNQAYDALLSHQAEHVERTDRLVATLHGGVDELGIAAVTSLEDIHA